MEANGPFSLLGRWFWPSARTLRRAAVPSSASSEGLGPPHSPTPWGPVWPRSGAASILERGPQLSCCRAGSDTHPRQPPPVGHPLPLADTSPCGRGPPSPPRVSTGHPQHAWIPIAMSLFCRPSWEQCGPGSDGWWDVREIIASTWEWLAKPRGLLSY